MPLQIENGVLVKHIHEPGDTDIIVPEGVTEIADNAFDYSKRPNIKLPETLKRIGVHAFAWGRDIQVNIPESVTEIGKDAFLWCEGLTELHIPHGMTRLEEGVFAGCTGLTSVTIPENITFIGYRAFSDCYGLTSVTIPDTVTEISNMAFVNCLKLYDVTYGTYRIHGKWSAMKKIQPALEMLRSGDFSGSAEGAVKYPFLLAYWKVHRDEASLKIIAKQVSKVVSYAIENADIESIQLLTQTDGIIAKKNIDKFLQLAIDREQHEIYALLVNYKAEKLGFRSIESQFRL